MDCLVKPLGDVMVNVGSSRYLVGFPGSFISKKKKKPQIAAERVIYEDIKT